MLAGYLLLRLGAAVRRQAQARHWPLAAVIVAGGTAFLAVESAFQFPFAMAFGCLGAAMLLGLALSLLETDGRPAVPQPVAWRPAARLATIAAALVGAFALARLVRSDYLTGTAAPDAARPHEACDLNPRNLRACLNAAWLDARTGNRQDARVRAAAILDRSPYYYPAIKLLADESLAQGDVRAGCFHLWIYDSLFDGRSAEHDRLSALCDPALLDALAVASAVRTEPGPRATSVGGRVRSIYTRAAPRIPAASPESGASGLERTRMPRGVRTNAYPGIFSTWPGWILSGSLSWSRLASKILWYLFASP